MTNTKTVFESNGISIVREMTYGFRANNATASWSVHVNGVFYCSALRLKGAKKIVESMLAA